MALVLVLVVGQLVRVIITLDTTDTRYYRH